MRAKAAHDVLNELIRIATEGEHFYREAALRVTDADAADTFVAMATARLQLIQDFASWTGRHGGEPAWDGTLLGAMRRLYAEARAQLADDADSLFVSQLEEMEDLLLEYYETALETTPDPEVRTVLQRHLHPIQSAHERLRRLQPPPERGGTNHFPHEARP